MKDEKSILNILLRDHTTQSNIFWAIDNYEYLGNAYPFSAQITSELITEKNGSVVVPRVKKTKICNKHECGIWWKSLHLHEFAMLKTI